MDYIRYIEKTHEYYRGLGYDKTYNYAYNEDIPFVPLKLRQDLQLRVQRGYSLRPVEEAAFEMPGDAGEHGLVPSVRRGGPSSGRTQDVRHQ